MDKNTKTKRSPRFRAGTVGTLKSTARVGKKRARRTVKYRELVKRGVVPGFLATWGYTGKTRPPTASLSPFFHVHTPVRLIQPKQRSGRGTRGAYSSYECSWGTNPNYTYPGPQQGLLRPTTQPRKKTPRVPFRSSKLVLTLLQRQSRFGDKPVTNPSSLSPKKSTSIAVVPASAYMRREPRMECWRGETSVPNDAQLYSRRAAGHVAVYWDVTFI